MSRMSKYIYADSDFKISKREIMVSIAILFISIAVGFLISTAISNSVAESNEVYYKALKINNDSDQFIYGMKTNVGNSLVYGELKCVDPVSIPEITGEYWSIERDAYKYTRHTRQVTKKDAKGKEYTVTEEYYSWDHYDSDSWNSNSFTFLKTEFLSSKFTPSNYSTLNLSTDTVPQNYQSWIGGWDNYLYKDGDKWESVGDIRFRYSVIPISFNGTIETSLKDNTMYGLNNTKNINVRYEQTIERVISDIEKSEGTPTIVFWIIWIILTGIGIFMFIYYDNKWLEDSTN